jgi:2-polyprenyl-3-methyl-5-hydroxy-6-metoxy-1,4-benzoquinol methylase
MEKHYGADYDRAVAAAGVGADRWRSRWDTLLKYKAGGTILDLGCSAGGFLGGLKGPSWKLHGIEMSETVARTAETISGAKVFVGDILDAPYPPQSFDVITCFHVFEHLYRPDEVLTKVSTWLKPGGIFFTMMPNIESAGYRIFKSYWYALELPRHLYHFSPTSLRRLASSVGLEEERVITKHEIFIEPSVRYILDDIFRSFGIKRKPLAKASNPGVPYRLVRKGFRITALPVLNAIASLAGDGESIHAIFRKN